MKEKIREYILACIEEEGMDVETISSCSLNVKPSRVRHLLIFWSVKVEKGVKSRITIPLDRGRETGYLAQEVIEDLLCEAMNISLADRMEMKLTKKKEVEDNSNGKKIF